MRYSILLTYILTVSLHLQGQKKYTYDDGPYITFLEDKMEILWLEQGNLHLDTISMGLGDYFQTDRMPNIEYDKLTIRPYTQFEFDSVSKFTAISDIHGQYELFVKLLQTHGIIDEALNWSYGDGHLIIVGDVLDRGPQVIEALWLIYHLEGQALASGGRVHMLLGNHELMVINNNLGYLNKKYLYTSGISQRLYSQFFSQNTFFGKWLSSKPITVSINDNLFVHGGFSPRIQKLNLNMAELNGIFQNRLLYEQRANIEADSVLNMLYFENGPLWYRGYAFPSAFDKDRAKSILNTFNKKRIIVGHTSMPEIKSLYGNRIILVDSSIKFGKEGEMLQYEDGHFLKAHSDGTKKELVSQEDKIHKQSIFSTIYNDPEPTLRLATDIKTVYKTGEEKYTESLLYYFHEGFPYSFNVGIRSSGNMRRQICTLPPLKLNFKKKELKAFGYAKGDKFKILMPCKPTHNNAQNLYMEHLIYEIYSIIDSFGFQSKIANVIIEDEKKDPKDYLSLILEHKDHLVERLDVIRVEKGVIRPAALDREDYIKFCLFQFMIANPDWGLVNRHNLVPIKKKNKTLVSLIPYDFDYCGLIRTEYAVPHASLPISDVSQRYFMDKNITMEEVKPVLKELLKSKDQVLDHCRSVAYLDEKHKDKALKFMEKSYQMLENEKRVRKYLGLKEN
ncbi:MAG: hypothetical protein HKN09_00160 [Saprospiraceae bacterium]|nr:hypothetical protein [Saprospiraceae bacterium]